MRILTLRILESGIGNILIPLDYSGEVKKSPAPLAMRGLFSMLRRSVSDRAYNASATRKTGIRTHDKETKTAIRRGRWI